MHPEWIPQVELSLLPNTFLWTAAISWIDPVTGAHGYLTSHEEPSAAKALRALEAAMATVPWPWMHDPLSFPRPMLVVPQSLQTQPPLWRSVARLARTRHWDLDFQPFDLESE